MLQIPSIHTNLQKFNFSSSTTIYFIRIMSIWVDLIGWFEIKCTLLFEFAFSVFSE